MSERGRLRSEFSKKEIKKRWVLREVGIFCSRYHDGQQVFLFSWAREQTFSLGLVILLYILPAHIKRKGAQKVCPR